jgi:hypothetical protein
LLFFKDLGGHSVKPPSERTNVQWLDPVKMEKIIS